MDAARRIADGLRGFGVGVWFDQRELRGGDAWDAKIKKQIRDCALFIPIVSANTQARQEGYFRREWKLAVERTHDMAASRAFLLPVVIDATSEADAEVPEEFMRVQWTRLDEAVPSPEFIEQVKRLLMGRMAPASAHPLGVELRPPVEPHRNGVRERETRSRRRERAFRMVGVAAAAIGIGVFSWTRLSPTSAAVPEREAASQGSAPRAPQTTPVPKVDDKSIAVLPFVNMSDDKDASAFFADGIHEDILTNLALIRELRVVSRTSVMGYRGTTKKIGEIARELGVNYVLEGSVRRAGSQVRVTGQLIQASNDEHLWASNYDRQLTDIFSIQTALAQEIATALKTTLSPEEKRLLERRPTEHVAAYDLFLQARQASLVFGHNPASRQRAEVLVAAAVELDPQFAAGWALLASTHVSAIDYGWDQTAARFAQATAAMERAVRLAPDSPEVMLRRGTYQHMIQYDYRGAREEYDKLTRLQPNDALVWARLGAVARRQGRWDEAISHYRKATQLDPANVEVAARLAWMLTCSRKYEDALAEQRRVTGLPHARLGHVAQVEWLAFLARGSKAEMDAFFRRLKVDQLQEPRAIALRKGWAATSGEWAEAKRLDEVQPHFAGDGQPPSPEAVNAAAVCLALGDAAAARARLGQLPEQLRARLRWEPDNPWLWCDIGAMEAILGHHAEALRCARKATELLPETKNDQHGTAFSIGLARVYAWTGERDRAIAELARLLRKPSDLNVHELRSGPWFVSLRGDPRFEALLTDPKNNAPLF